METTTETYQYNRELTSTEIKIAIAQIEDRLIRVAKAQDELHKISLFLDESSNSSNYDNLRKSLKQKYDIPNGVHLFGALTDDEAPYKTFMIQAKKHINSFVKGQLTAESLLDLYFFFEEYAECDYGWILIEKPSGFYGADGFDCTIEENIKEIKSIGCRSKIKNKKLPILAPLYQMPKKTFVKLSEVVGWSKSAI